MSNDFTQGGPSAPFGSQHHDDSLSPSPSYNLPGDGDEKAMDEYIQGKEPFFQHPVGRTVGNNPSHSHAGTRDVSSTKSMEQHGARQERRKAERKSKANPVSSARKMGY
jgi:hypothetical protein